MFRSSLVILSFVLTAVVAHVPNDVSNYLNTFICDPRVRLIRPETVDDVEETVKRYTNVQAIAAGHSWNLQFFCPNAEDAASIVMTTIRPLTIDVNEEDLSAWVSAGVEIWDLMVYLGNYVTPSSPRGYALGSTPFYLNQTIGGAVATGTHGSSLAHGSLSNQAIGFKVVVANGTSVEITPDSHPLYFKAFQVNVGRLGVVTHVKMRIIKESLVERTMFTNVSVDDIVALSRDIQEKYKSTGELLTDVEGSNAMFDASSFSYIVSSHRIVQTAEESTFDSDFAEESMAFAEEYLRTKINTPVTLPRTEGDGDVADGVSWVVPIPSPPNPVLADPNSTFTVLSDFINFMLEGNPNVTLDTYQASFNFPEIQNRTEYQLVDDYEVAVNVSNMADCLEGLVALMEEMKPDIGLRYTIFNRLVPKEEGLLSVSHDKPMLYFSMADVVYYNRVPPSRNVPFQRLIAYLVSSPNCTPGRLHWGKAGWPDAGCWNGAEKYKETWCDFGCVVRDLDPENKFVGLAPEVWNWEGAHLDSCCTPDGYDKSRHGCDCQVKPIRTPENCPPPPFYTTR